MDSTEMMINMIEGEKSVDVLVGTGLSWVLSQFVS
jgi:hypothetical protein